MEEVIHVLPRWCHSSCRTIVNSC